MDRQDFENKLIDWLDRPEAPDDLTSDPEERHALRAWRHTSEQIRSRLQLHEPPAALDQKILRAARQQAAQYASPPTRSWLHFLQQWQPIATFATLTLVVGMTFLLSQKTLFDQESAAPSLSVRDVAPAAPQVGQRAAHSPMPAQAKSSAEKDPNSPPSKQNALPSAPQGGFPKRDLTDTRTTDSKATGTVSPKASDDASGSHSLRYAPPPAEEKRPTPSASPTTPEKKTRSVGDFFRRLFSSKRKAKAKDAAPSSFAEGRNPSAKAPQPTAPTTATPSPALTAAPTKTIEPSKEMDDLAKKQDIENKRTDDADLPSPRMAEPPPQRNSASELSTKDQSRSRRGRAIRRYRTPTLRRRSRTRRKPRKVRERKGYGYTGSKPEPTQQATLPLSEPVLPKPAVRQQRKRRARPIRRLPRPAKRRPAPFQQPERGRASKAESAGIVGGNHRPSAPPPPPPSVEPPSVPKKPISVPRAESLDQRKHKLPQPTQSNTRAPIPAPPGDNEHAPTSTRDPAPSRQQPPTRETVALRQDGVNVSDSPEISVLSNKWPAAKKQQLARLHSLLQSNQTPQAIALAQQVLTQTPPTQRAALRRALLDFAKKNRYSAFFQGLSALPQP